MGIDKGQDNKNMKSLDLSVLNSKKTVIVSSTEALKEITPINLSKNEEAGES